MGKGHGWAFKASSKSAFAKETSLTFRPARRSTCMQDQRHISFQHLVTPVPLILIRNHAQRLALLRFGLIDHFQTDPRLSLGDHSDDLDVAFLAGLDCCRFGARGGGDEEDGRLGVFEVERDFGLRVCGVQRRGDRSVDRSE